MQKFLINIAALLVLLIAGAWYSVIFIPNYGGAPLDTGDKVVAFLIGTFVVGLAAIVKYPGARTWFENLGS